MAAARTSVRPYASPLSARHFHAFVLGSELHQAVAVAEHHGTVIKVAGQAFLVDFSSVVHAVQCAQHVQGQFRPDNAEQGKAEQVPKKFLQRKTNLLGGNLVHLQDRYCWTDMDLSS